MLENPDNISKTVLAKGLDSGTAFEILSIDIADVDVGKNIGAELRLTRRGRTKILRRPKQKNCRAMAVAAGTGNEGAGTRNESPRCRSRGRSANRYG